MIDIVPLYAFLYSIQMTLSMEYSDKKFSGRQTKLHATSIKNRQDRGNSSDFCVCQPLSGKRFRVIITTGKLNFRQLPLIKSVQLWYPIFRLSLTWQSTRLLTELLYVRVLLGE